MSQAALPNPIAGSSFWRDAFAWRGSITRRLMPHVGVFGAYAALVAFLHRALDWRGVDPIHLGYTGGLLAVLLMLRTNAGNERWWEARKLWGGIVNQSRNLAIMGARYGPADRRWQRAFLGTCAAFCHAARQSLRGDRDRTDFARVIGDARLVDELLAAPNMPVWVATRLARLLTDARGPGALDGFEFLQADGQRAMLVDHIGACERILKTPLARVHSIKLRRFIFIYLVAVPFALASSSVLFTAAATMLVAYPLLAIDGIAHELENPFSTQRESHLPLDAICRTIENDVLGLQAAARGLVSSHDELHARRGLAKAAGR